MSHKPGSQPMYDGAAGRAEDPLMQQWMHFDQAVWDRLLAPYGDAASRGQPDANQIKAVKEVAEKYEGVRRATNEVLAALNDVTFAAPDSTLDSTPVLMPNPGRRR